MFNIVFTTAKMITLCCVIFVAFWYFEWHNF